MQTPVTVHHSRFKSLKFKAASVPVESEFTDAWQPSMATIVVSLRPTDYICIRVASATVVFSGRPIENSSRNFPLCTYMHTIVSNSPIVLYESVTNRTQYCQNRWKATTNHPHSYFFFFFHFFQPSEFLIIKESVVYSAVCIICDTSVLARDLYTYRINGFWFFFSLALVLFFTSAKGQ